MADDVRDRRTTLRSPLTSALDIPASPRPAEGALGPYLRAIRAHRTLVIAVTLVAIAASVLWIVARPANYEATANLLVTPVAQENETFLGLDVLRDSGDPTRSVQTAGNQIHSYQAAQRTAAAMGGDWTANKVLDAVKVTPEGESNILAVTASADGAREAARLANTFARSALDARRDTLAKQAAAEVERLDSLKNDLGPNTEALATVTERINALEKVRVDGDPTISLSQTAQAPESPSGPPAPVVFVLAGLAGFMLGSGAALLLELTERRIRNEDEAVSLYPLPVLARIPLLKASQLRGRQASGWHMVPAVREAFRTLMIQLGPHPEGRAHVVMVTSASTGDGKTTSAVNLAAAAAASGDPVILLDFDLRKPDVGRTLGVQPGTELTGLLQPDTQLRDLLSPAPGLPALSVLTTTVAEGDVALVEALSRRLPELIADARELCNYVVIDTAPIGEISDALRLVRDVDSIIVVTRPGNTNRANFEMMRDLLERTAYTPAGFLVIGDPTPRTSAYYAYGASGRDLFLPAAEPAPLSPDPSPPRVRRVPDDSLDTGREERERGREGGRRPSEGPRRPGERAHGRPSERQGGVAERSERAAAAARTGSEAGPARAPASDRPRHADGDDTGRGGGERPASDNGPGRSGGNGEQSQTHGRPARPPRSEQGPAKD
jgi:Mrp family chromosome partitioning ATPase